jgi:hypothetical protein
MSRTATVVIFGISEYLYRTRLVLKLVYETALLEAPYQTMHAGLGFQPYFLLHLVKRRHYAIGFQRFIDNLKKL